MECKFAELAPLGHGVTEENRGVVCSVIVGKVGIRCGMQLSACSACKYAEGDSSFVDQVAKRHLANLLISGNQPRLADTVDVPALAARFKPMSTEEEREEVVAKAIECQCIPPEKGGYDAATVARNLEELERELGVSAVLERLL